MNRAGISGIPGCSQTLTTSKGQWPQQQAKVAWVAGADTRHDPDAWRFKAYCLNTSASAVANRDGKENPYFSSCHGCMGWAFRDRRLKECKGCSAEYDYAWEAFHRGKQRMLEYKRDIGADSDDGQGWNQWHSWMQDKSQAGAAAASYDTSSSWNHDAHVGSARIEQILSDRDRPD